jgi:hypothetical protein
MLSTAVGPRPKVTADGGQGDVDDGRVHDADEHRGDEDNAHRYLLVDARGHGFLKPGRSPEIPGLPQVLIEGYG